MTGSWWQTGAGPVHFPLAEEAGCETKIIEMPVSKPCPLDILLTTYAVLAQIQEQKNSEYLKEDWMMKK